MIRWLVDTHAVLWAVTEPRRLGARARKILDNAEDGEVGVPSAAIMELGRLFYARDLGILVRPSDALAPLLSRHPILPASFDAAVKAPHLDLPHGDPFDRFIVAEALVRELPLITMDGNIPDSGLVPVVW